MYQFDVKYTFENYYEYYKFVLIKQRIFRDIIFSLLFFGVAIYWLVDQSDNTSGYVLPIFAIVMGIIFPLMNFATIPMLKKQIHAKQAEIDRTHILVTFNDEEVVYENLTVKPEAPVEAPVEEAPAEEAQISEEAKQEAQEVLEAPAAEESKDAETKVEEAPAKEEEQTVFKLQYANFQQVREIDNLFLFYLDRQTIVILPKATLSGNIDEFKAFVASKVDAKRVKFLKK